MRRPGILVVLVVAVLLGAAVFAWLDQRETFGPRCRHVGEFAPVTITNELGWHDVITAGVAKVVASEALLTGLGVDVLRLETIFAHRLGNSDGAELSMDLRVGAETNTIELRLCQDASCLSRSLVYPALFASCIRDYQATSIIYTGAVMHLETQINNPVEIGIGLGHPGSTDWFDSFMSSPRDSGRPRRVEGD